MIYYLLDLIDGLLLPYLFTGPAKYTRIVQSSQFHNKVIQAAIICHHMLIYRSIFGLYVGHHGFLGCILSTNYHANLYVMLPYDEPKALDSDGKCCKYFKAGITCIQGVYATILPDFFTDVIS